MNTEMQKERSDRERKNFSVPYMIRMIIRRNSKEQKYECMKTERKEDDASL